jgi:TonB family protein
MRIESTWLTLLLLLGSHVTLSQETKSSPPPSRKDPERIYTAKEVDIKARVKPVTDSPQPGRDCFEHDYPREVILKVVLHKSGVVTDVTLVKKSGCSYDKDAIRVARTIEFQPAKKDNEDVSQYLTLQFAYEKP